jgi:hypothetical protein
MSNAVQISSHQGILDESAGSAVAATRGSAEGQIDQRTITAKDRLGIWPAPFTSRVRRGWISGYRPGNHRIRISLALQIGLLQEPSGSAQGSYRARATKGEEPPKRSSPVRRSPSAPANGPPRYRGFCHRRLRLTRDAPQRKARLRVFLLSLPPDFRSFPGRRHYSHYQLETRVGESSLKPRTSTSPAA